MREREIESGRSKCEREEEDRGGKKRGRLRGWEGGREREREGEREREQS